MVARPRWFDDVRAGDLLQAPSGDIRLVREVHRYHKEPWRFTVAFAIRHRSWTNRGYTIYSHSDDYLKRMVRVGRNYKRKKISVVDRWLQLDIVENRVPPLVTAQDVDGLP